MKKAIILISFIFLLRCGKQAEKFNMPFFWFSYIDAKNDYVIKYSGKDTLYLTDKILNKNYYSVIDKEQGTELSKIIIQIGKPEYFSSYENGNVNQVYFRFSIVREDKMPKSFPYNKNADNEVFEAALKVNRIRTKLNFVPTDKEYQFSQMKNNSNL